MFELQRKYEMGRTLASYISIIKGTLYKRRKREPHKKYSRKIFRKYFDIYEEEISILNKRMRRRVLSSIVTSIKQRIYSLYQSARREKR